MQEQDGKPVGANLRLATAQDPGPGRDKMIAGCQNIVNFVADVMDAAARVLGHETEDGGISAKWLQQLDFCVRQQHENHGNAMIRQCLRGRDLGAKSVAVDG